MAALELIFAIVSLLRPTDVLASSWAVSRLRRLSLSLVCTERSRHIEQ